MVEQNGITVPYNTQVEFTVACEGYNTYTEIFTILDDIVKNVEL